MATRSKFPVFKQEPMARPGEDEAVTLWLAQNQPTALPTRMARVVGESSPGWRHNLQVREEAAGRFGAAQRRVKKRLLGNV